MRLLVVALLALLVNCFASSSHSIDVSPALEIIEGYFHDHSIIGRDATKCSVSQPCIDGVCCNGQGMYDPPGFAGRRVLMKLRLLRSPYCQTPHHILCSIQHPPPCLRADLACPLEHHWFHSHCPRFRCLRSEDFRGWHAAP